MNEQCSGLLSMLVEQMVFHCSITVLETIKMVFTISSNVFFQSPGPYGTK